MANNRKIRYIIENNTIRPLPTGLHYPEKKRSRIKVLLSTLAAVAALSGFSFKMASSKSNTAAKTSARSAITSVDMNRRTSDNFSDQALSTSPQNTIKQLTQILRHTSKNALSANQATQQAELLQMLSTRSDGVCTASLLSPQDLKDFMQMCKHIPSDQLIKATQNNPNNPPFYSFKALAMVLQNEPQNSYKVRQQMFLQLARYRTHKRFAAKAPSFEKNKNFIYLDAATKLEKGRLVPDDHPTVYKGLNLHAYPELLKYMRIQNSAKLQEILHPTDPQNRSDDEWIYLSKSDLNRWVKYALDQGFHNYKPEHFKKEYGLIVHPDDLSNLERHFQKAVANAVKTAERELEKRELSNTSEDESVMFGSFLNPIPARMPVVATDLAYSSKNPLRDKNGWPTFCKKYETRDFWAASRETRSGQAGIHRNVWRRYNMTPYAPLMTTSALTTGVAGGLALLGLAHRRRKRRS